MTLMQSSKRRYRLDTCKSCKRMMVLCLDKLCKSCKPPSERKSKRKERVA